MIGSTPMVTGPSFRAQGLARRALWLSRRGPCTSGRRPLVHVYGAPATDLRVFKDSFEIGTPEHHLLRSLSPCPANITKNAYHVPAAVAAFVAGLLQIDHNIWHESLIEN